MVFWISIALLGSAIVLGLVMLYRRYRQPKTKISFLVPFHSDGAQREEDWDWLQQYWDYHFPEAEIIVEDNDDVPFCKTCAVNKAFERSTGDIIVILDADCYISPDVINHCAQEIRKARSHNRALWFIPYRRLYRLTEVATNLLLDSDWSISSFFTEPLNPDYYTHNHDPSSGHHWAALIQILPREAFQQVEGMDERFQGWGGEDVSFMNLVDTFYGRHKTVNAPVFHLWHPIIPGRWKGTRQWPGQEYVEINEGLSERFEQARGDQRLMEEVVKH